MGSRRAQLSLFGVALLIGLLLVGQLRSQARPRELTSLSAQELSTLVETLSARNRQLGAGLSDLTEQLRSYALAQSQGQSNLTLSTEALHRILAFAGLEAVEGQGIVMRVDGALDAIAVNDLINELRNASAEAIAIDDVRITARSVAVQGPRSLQVDGVDVGRSFIVRVIGNPEGLMAQLQRPGGTIAQLKQFVSATIDVQQRTAADGVTILLPATRQSLAPKVARPIE